MNLFESSKIHAAFIACSKLSISRDDAVKDVLKYEGVNLRDGGDTVFFFSCSGFLNFADRLSQSLEKATILLSSGRPSRKNPASSPVASIPLTGWKRQQLKKPIQFSNNVFQNDT